MAKIEAFEKNYNRYEKWFENNKYVYLSELNAIEHFIPKNGYGMEVGVGSGRFSAPLGIKIGVEPSKEMREIAKTKGVEAFDAVGEKMPFEDSIFDYVLMVTTICFLDDVEKAFFEVKRVLKNGGRFIVGFVDKDSPLGLVYQKHKTKNVFYKDAIFYSADEVISLLKDSGFTDIEAVQTIFSENLDIEKIEDCKEGYGKGGFCVLKASKK